MELLLIWRILRRWAWLIAIPVLITVALAVPSLLNRGGASGGFTETITFSAMQSITAIPRTDGDYQDIWLSSELTVNAFSDWVKNSSFKQELAKIVPNANLDALSIATDNAHSVGQIYLSYPTADGLQALGDAAIKVLSTRNQAYFAQLGGQPATVTVLGQTPVTAAPPAITDRLGPLIRIGLGLLAGLALAFLAHYLDPVLRRREDVESLGLPVVGAIPRQ